MVESPPLTDALATVVGAPIVVEPRHAPGPEVTSIGRYDAGRYIHLYEGPTYPRLAYREEVRQHLAFYTEVFVGRELELASVARFAAQPKPGYLLVEAPPGFGKSAFVAELIRRHNDGVWFKPTPDLVYFFVREEGGWHRPEAFCAAMNSQLLDLLGERGGVPADLESQRGQLYWLWTRAMERARPERPLLLLVDGLDEMRRVAVGETTIAHLLPGQLKSHVHVVVTSRPNPEPQAQVGLEDPFSRPNDVLRLNALGHADLEALLRIQLGSVELAQTLATRVLEVSHGEPLLARFMSEDVAAGGEQLLARLERDPPRREGLFSAAVRTTGRARRGRHCLAGIGYHQRESIYCIST